MIVEAIQHFLTPSPREVKALGYVREAIAIEARFARCHDAWTDHLDKCKYHILAAANLLAPKSTIMIIGSGALHDVPMADLIDLEHALILVDIVHLPKIQKKYKKQIQLIEQDVTGWVRPLYHNNPYPETACRLPKADLVISLNILSQLPLNLLNYAEKNHIPLPNDFMKNITDSHLKLLKSVAPQSLIISDIERCYNRGGELLERESVFAEIDLPTPKDSWDWLIAPKGELDRDAYLIHHVACWLGE